jgi:hypothetical protein
MYVQYKNYSLGKTTHERFSKRAASALSKADQAPEEAAKPSSVQEAADIENDATTELLKAQKRLETKRQKRGCCTNFKMMMYTKERPT